MLTGLTNEQNEELRRLHVEAMESLEKLKILVKTGDALADKLALFTFAQAQTYLELGDFESDPRFPK